MLKPEFLLFPLLVALTGCYTAPKSHAPDWAAEPDATMEVEHVTEGREIAPAKDLPALFPAGHTNESMAGTWVSLEHWAHDHHLGAIQQITAAPNHIFTLTTSNGVFTLGAHSRMARWNGAEFYLGFEPQMFGDEIFVNALDLKKNLEPLLPEFFVSAKTNRTIVVDPGHGGSNAGTSSLTDGQNEKNFTLDWALRLEPLLTANGWQVFLTRTNDVDLSLSNRVAFAEAHHADLFISLHFNAVENNREQSGLETICLTPSGMPSTFTRGYEDNPALVFPNNAFDAENLQYAMHLHRSLLAACNFNDRGVRRARFLGVIRGQNRPAVLVEAGFLSNTEEARRIADPEFRQKLAETLAAALK